MGPDTLIGVPAKQKTPVVPKPPTSLVRRARKMDRVLAETYPDAKCELDFETPFQLLVATILSAQTTDRRVNAVTPGLFAQYPTQSAWPRADRAESRRSSGPPGSSGPRPTACCGCRLRSSSGFDGEVPATLEDLVTLPGVGRKTANVVLGNAFGIPGSPSTPISHGRRDAMGWTDEKTRGPDPGRSRRSAR